MGAAVRETSALVAVIYPAYLRTPQYRRDGITRLLVHDQFTESVLLLSQPGGDRGAMMHE